ncbi:MAG: hypothetical protein CMJ78_05045 [Planctomycetaceae bacterium]|nr:hypothetical protein [Planctomycetaceae bacterium]
MTNPAQPNASEEYGFPSLSRILGFGVVGFVVVLVGSLLGNVTLAPLLLFGAPAMFVAMALRVSSPVLIGVIGFVVYAIYGALLTSPRWSGYRWIPILGVLLFHVGSMFAISLAPCCLLRAFNMGRV